MIWLAHLSRAHVCIYPLLWYTQTPNQQNSTDSKYSDLPCAISSHPVPLSPQWLFYKISSLPPPVCLSLSSCPYFSFSAETFPPLPQLDLDPSQLSSCPGSLPGFPRWRDVLPHLLSPCSIWAFLQTHFDCILDKSVHSTSSHPTSQFIRKGRREAGNPYFYYPQSRGCRPRFTLPLTANSEKSEFPFDSKGNWGSRKSIIRSQLLMIMAPLIELGIMDRTQRI